MERYNIIFQDSEVLMVIMAENSQEARQKFNKQISIRIRKNEMIENCQKDPKDISVSNVISNTVI